MEKRGKMGRKVERKQIAWIHGKGERRKKKGKENRISKENAGEKVGNGRTVESRRRGEKRGERTGQSLRMAAIKEGESMGKE